MKKLPIKAAKTFSEEYDQDQVIIVTWDKKEGLTHSVSYGKTEADCSQAAVGANIVREALNFPQEACYEVPMRARKSPPLVDYRVEFEGGTPMTCVRIPPGGSYGKRKYGDVVVVIVQACNLEDAILAAHLNLSED